MSLNSRCDAPRQPGARRLGRGISLIELMVTLAIALVMSLAIVGVLSASHGRQRTTSTVNDLLQSGNFALYTIDRWVRNAGSGYLQAADHALGCTLYAGRLADKATAATRILPRGSTALPPPFDTLNPTGTAGVFRLAPVIIVPNGSTPVNSNKPSDVLIVMSGASGLGQMPVEFSKTAMSTDNSLALVNTVQFGADDLLLVSDRQADLANPGACLIEQVDAAFVSSGTAVTLPLAGRFAVAKVDTVNLTDFTSAGGRATNLGNAAEAAGTTVRNPPRFLVIGVGVGDTLFSYDLLHVSSFEEDDQDDATTVPVADAVFEMHALYGVDSDGDGKVDLWVKPDSALFTPSVLLAGTTAARDRLLTIRAVRIGLIMKSPLKEKTRNADSSTDSSLDAVPAPSLVLFADLGTDLAYTRDPLTSDQQRFRYRTVESTIPLRNVMLLPPAPALVLPPPTVPLP